MLSDMHAITLIVVCHVSKSLSKKMIVLYIQDCEDLEKITGELPPAPRIVVLTSDESKQFFVVAEKEILTESTSLKRALVDVIAAFFTFDMAYPKQLYPVLLFIQHHILDIKDDQQVPNIVRIVFSALDRL